MSDTINIKMGVGLPDGQTSGASFLLFDHSVNPTAMPDSSIFNVNEISTLLSSHFMEKPVLRGDDLVDQLQGRELGNSAFKIYTNNEANFPSIYIGSSQALDFRSPVYAESLHYSSDDIQGDGSISVAYAYNLLDTIFVDDEIAIYTHQLHTGGEFLKIEANGTIINQDTLSEALTKVKGIEVIQLQGQYNTLNLKLEDLLQLSDTATRLHIVGESQNAITLDLVGQGFTASSSQEFTTYTNGNFSIVIENTLDRGGIIL